jgi:YD repeat-containing protein
MLRLAPFAALVLALLPACALQLYVDNFPYVNPGEDFSTTARADLHGPVQGGRIRTLHYGQNAPFLERELQYNRAGQLTVEIANAQDGTRRWKHQYRYDDKQRMIAASADSKYLYTRAVRYTFTYDDAGRLTAQVGFDAKGIEVSRSTWDDKQADWQRRPLSQATVKDTLGRTSAQVTTKPDGARETVILGEDGKPAEIFETPAQGAAKHIVLTYDAQGNRASATVYNQREQLMERVAYIYNAENRLIETRETTAKGVLFRRVRSGYDAAGRLTSRIVDGKGAVTEKAFWKYDAAGRLLAETTSRPMIRQTLSTMASTTLVAITKAGGKPVKARARIVSQPQPGFDTRTIVYTYDDHGNWTKRKLVSDFHNVMWLGPRVLMTAREITYHE